MFSQSGEMKTKQNKSHPIAAFIIKATVVFTCDSSASGNGRGVAKLYVFLFIDFFAKSCVIFSLISHLLIKTTLFFPKRLVLN